MNPLIVIDGVGVTYKAVKWLLSENKSITQKEVKKQKQYRNKKR